MQRDKLRKALVELKKAQEQLIAAEKYKQAKDIAGGVAHEIHNALSPALNSLDKLQQVLLATETTDPERIGRLLNLIERSLMRANNMTELVNRYSRLEAEKKGEPVDLNSIFEEIAGDNRERLEKLKVKFDLVIPRDLKISCYKPHAYSLFNNLLLNSLDAVSGTDGQTIRAVARGENRKVRIEFSDSGPGIPVEDLPRIFDAFYSTRPSTGTGLGLAMVRKIVELYDGQIEVESVLDKGAKFTILLPAG